MHRPQPEVDQVTSYQITILQRKCILTAGCALHPHPGYCITLTKWSVRLSWKTIGRTWFVVSSRIGSDAGSEHEETKYPLLLQAHTRPVLSTFFLFVDFVANIGCVHVDQICRGSRCQKNFNCACTGWGSTGTAEPSIDLDTTLIPISEILRILTASDGNTGHSVCWLRL